MSKKDKKRRKEQDKKQEKEEKKARKKQEKAAGRVELETGLENVPAAPELQQGTYSDGHPLDEVHYLECKLILKAERFTSVKSFRQFADFVRQRLGPERGRFRHQQVCRDAAADPRGALPRHARLPALQQRLHPATPDALRERFSGGRARGGLQVPSSRPADGGRDRRAAEHSGPACHEVQGRGAAAQGTARRVPPALLAHRPVPHERRAGQRDAHRRPRDREGPSGAAESSRSPATSRCSW